MKKKYAVWLLSAGAAVVLIDAFAGMQAAKNSGEMPSWFSSTLGPVENALPLPLGLSLAVAGGVVYFMAKA